MSEEITDSEREALAALGYDERWLSSGLLDRTLLEAQHARMLAGGTRKTATYRTAALEAWREAHPVFSDEEIDAYLEVVGADADAKLVASALAALIDAPQLSIDQLERIARSDPSKMRKHEARIRRSFLRRKLEAGFDDTLFEQVLESQDAALHTSLLRDERLARKHAELLAQRGANTTIREKAQAWVLDKKAWR